MADNSLLIVETPSTTCLDSAFLAKQNYDIHRCQSASSAFDTASAIAPAVILISAYLPDMQLVDFVGAFSRTHKDTVILVMVESKQGQLAAEAMSAGAADYLLKPFTDQQLVLAIDQAMSLRKPLADLVVSSAASRQVIQLALRAAQTDATVLISGESGTGKERLARYLHDNSPRSSGPFIALNCAAIPETMIEAVLFGHNKGAYTGAVNSQAGKFELANGGTLMLDEISEMQLTLQAKLLRVLQEREVERLGSNQKVDLDIRIIAATNKTLSEQVSQGLFREDLYYRLDVLPLSWPALRERHDDIIPLTDYFIQKYAPSPNYSISHTAKQALQAHKWPGNVRELENVIQRALIMARGMELQVADLMLPAQVIEHVQLHQNEHNAQGLESSKKQAEYQYVLDTLEQFSGHKTKTAAALGVTPRALRYKMAAMREQGIEV